MTVGQSTAELPAFSPVFKRGHQQHGAEEAENCGRDDEGGEHGGGSFRALNIGDEGRLHNG